ncbi:MAG: tRNA (5-methylaminomethyl-2-thiouridine)(34)-methyltransferase MnmD [Burkholderiaceae bacterium]
MNTSKPDAAKGHQSGSETKASLGHEQVTWSDEHGPINLRFNDIYRTKGTGPRGGLDQARHVFLAGCGLLGQAPLWQRLAHWSILETGFGLGLNFLATYHAWLKDPLRPTHLHYVSIEAYAVSAKDIERSTLPYEELLPLSKELLTHYWGLTPGFHRITLANGFVHLTLCIGSVQDMLKQLDAHFDSIYLDGFAPQKNPQMWSALTMKGVAMHAKWGAKAATWSVGKDVRAHLQAAGFVCEKTPGLPPKREALSAHFAPAWQDHMRVHRPKLQVVDQQEQEHEQAHAGADAPSVIPQTVLIVGAGLAGASTAWALATRGFKVRVLDQQARPSFDASRRSLNSPPRPLSQGASGLPFGLFHPMNSSDDNLQSKMTRAGIRHLLGTLTSLTHLERQVHFDTSGVLEKKKPVKKTLKTSDFRPKGEDSLESKALSSEWFVHWSRLASSQEASHLESPSLLDEASKPLLHEKAGWVDVQALLTSLLDHPNISISQLQEVHLIEGHLHERHDPSSGEGLRRTCEWSVHSRTVGANAEPNAQSNAQTNAQLNTHTASHLILTSSVATPSLIVHGLKFLGAGAKEIEQRTQKLAQTWPLQAIKGQLCVGLMKDLQTQSGSLPSFAVNGQSSWIGHLQSDLLKDAQDPNAQENVETDLKTNEDVKTNANANANANTNTNPSPELFCIGASFERDLEVIENTLASRQSNLHKFKMLLPELSLHDKATLFDWSGVRSTCHDRLPLAGILNRDLPNLLVCTALGSRGLSMSGVLAEHLCALITHEPSPLPLRLIHAIAPDRFKTAD